MCRSIKVLRGSGEVAAPDEISAAALQFVRKVSGSRKPSKANQAAFDAAVEKIARETALLLRRMGPGRPPKTPEQTGDLQ